jgi:hypothetical protein
MSQIAFSGAMSPANILFFNTLQKREICFLPIVITSLDMLLQSFKNKRPMSKLKLLPALDKVF